MGKQTESQLDFEKDRSQEIFYEASRTVTAISLCTYVRPAVTVRRRNDRFTMTQREATRQTSPEMQEIALEKAHLFRWREGLWSYREAPLAGENSMRALLALEFIDIAQLINLNSPT